MGFLPAVYEGVQFRSGRSPVLYLENPRAFPARAGGRRWTAQATHQRQYEQSHDPEILARIEQYEMAYRMQSSVPEVADISDEPASILEMYGPDVQTRARLPPCLLARRLAERGVQFVQLFHPGWDSTATCRRNSQQCRETDQPCAALLQEPQAARDAG